MITDSLGGDIQLQGSQFPWPAPLAAISDDATGLVNPRVGPLATRGLEALSVLDEAKISGGHANNNMQLNAMRKRAYRRAKRRAEAKGATWYRGRWMTAQELGTTSLEQQQQTPRPKPTARPFQDTWTEQPRLRVRSYNVGGVTSEVYDHLHHWLLHQCTDDIVILQELHWGCGRHEAHWRVPGWLFYVSADERQRFSGVAVLVSERVASADQTTYCTWLPGRLLHVRCVSTKVTLDVIAGYQWVKRSHSDSKQEELRGLFLQKLGALLQSLPARNMVVIGADWNTHCHPLAGSIGRGVLKTATVRDLDLETFLQEHNLVFLNSWSSARVCRSHTFTHAGVKSQIDFIALRRPTADALSRRAKPEEFDLAPWRRGAKHHAVIATVPWRAGWTFRKRAQAPERFSLRSLKRSLEQMDDKARQLQGLVESILQEAVRCQHTLGTVNKQVLQHCQRLFPQERNKPETRLKPSTSQPVIQAVEQMWHARDKLRTAAPARGFKEAAARYRSAEAFKQASKHLRQVSRAARREWFESMIQTAEHAARRHDLSGIYRVINAIAPKRRREQVRIRGQQGQILNPQAEFDAIFSHFKGVFTSEAPFELPPRGPVTFTAEEVQAAIGGLKGGKAVPTASVPAELWKLCPTAYAQFFSELISSHPAERDCMPPEVTDCTLALIPKPHKQSRRPTDLRPLGLQDPSSKVIAIMVRDRLQASTLDYLMARPQYAYCPSKAIDDAICRVAQHCRGVRERVRNSVLTVHERREGRTTSTCQGGIMISIDLSRAFDNVPRWALQQSLEHAGATAELQHVVLELHERCKYQVTHRGHVGLFEMQKGVRQGCALSPYLYALFSCLIFDTLAARTSREWALAAMTLFADDSHLAWDIWRIEDLAFVTRCVQQTFRVFQEYGMAVNPDKSQITVRLRGSAAARWLRKHRVRVPGGGEVIDLGTPHLPLKIPKVAKMVYLGIIASYQGVELQTCLHRQQSALVNRHRLARTLHCRQLTQQQRTRLYVSCVRSSMLYGQHAVGTTPAVLRKHDQFDARVLRAIARAPSHLTHESTASLRQRLQVDSPHQVLKRTLERRVQKSQDPRSATWFKARLDELESQCQTTGPDSVGLTRPGFDLFQEVGIPCKVCGQYFPSFRVMRSHRARQHGYRGQNKTARAGVLPAQTYAAGSVQGMPQCAKCKKIFTRVEGLKKHLKSGCEGVTDANVHCEEAVTASVGQVPAERVELPRCWAPQTVLRPLPAIEHAVLADNAEFRLQVCRNWRSAAAKPEYGGVLKDHCVLCGQWSQRVKQHIRQMHPESWCYKDAAISQCLSAGLAATAPCSYCALSLRQPGRHLTNCPVVFQVSLLHQLLQPGGPLCHDEHGCGRAAGPAGAAGAGGCFRGCVEARGGTSSRESGGGGPSFKMAKGRQQAGQGSIIQFLGQQLERRPASQEALEGRCTAGSGERREQADTGAPEVPGEDDGEARARAHAHPSGCGLYSLRRYFKPRLCRAAAGSAQGLAGSVRSRHSEDRLEDDPRHEHDEGSQGAGRGNPPRRGEATKMPDRGLGGGNRDRTEPCVDISNMGLEREEASSLGSAAAQAHRGPPLGGCPPGKSTTGGSTHPVLVSEASAGDLYGGGDPCDPAAELARGGERCMPQGPETAEWQRLHEASGGPLEARADPEAATGSGSRGGILKYAVLRLESAGQPDPLATQGDLGRSSAAAALEGARPRAAPAMQAPALISTRLVNRTNVCYINATLQVLVWLTEFSGTCLGRLQAVSGILRAGRGIHLPDCFVLRGLFSTWAMLHQQHDAGEFLHHSLEFARAEAWNGRWEARLSNPAVVHDAGTLHQAILLHMRGATLQALLDAWSSQFAVHAITQHNGLLFLQLGRYASHSAKNRDKLRVRPGDSVAVPIFAEHSCTSLRHETFIVVAMVYHLGETGTSGHYLALLGLPTAAGWDYFVCDDNKAPRKARAADLDLVDSNCYLLGLMCTP